MRDLFLPALLYILTAGSWTLSALQFRQKGPLLNNTWLYASQKEREQMDKAPHYRQSGVVFLLLGLLFGLLGTGALLQRDWPLLLAGLTAAAAVVYAVLSSVRGEMK